MSPETTGIIVTPDQWAALIALTDSSKRPLFNVAGNSSNGLGVVEPGNAVGSNGASGIGGAGGNGTASSITGSSVTRAGGGGGCANSGNTVGSGGAGGGGSGGQNPSTNATAGTVNTGSGGGGARDPGNGGAGGKGVVILSLPTASYSSTTTGREALAFSKTDKDFLALQDHEDVIIQTAVAARLGVKSTLEETRTERFIGIGSRGRLPVPLKYYAAHTGRWGGADSLNLQNLPSRTGSSSLKKSIVAPQGFVMIDADSAQIEARMLAWLSGQNDLVEQFTVGEDVYRLMASAIYSKDVTKFARGPFEVLVMPPILAKSLTKVSAVEIVSPKASWPSSTFSLKDSN